MTHICTSRCNNDIDCEVCPHGVNVAQDECEECEIEEEGAKEKMIENEIDDSIMGEMDSIAEDTRKLQALIDAK